MTELITVKIAEDSHKIDWNVWFLIIAVLSLIAAALIPFIQKKYEEQKARIGFHLYIKKRIGIIWNLLTHDKFEYKQPTSANSLDDLALTFDKLLYRFDGDFQKNKNTTHPLFAFGILFNFQNLLFTVNRIHNALIEIDVPHLEEKTLEFGDKLSKEENLKLTGLFMLIQHYTSIISFHDKFGSLTSIKREMKNSKWTGLIVEPTVVQNQQIILSDLQFLKGNEVSVNEILNINKLLIQELKSYFDYNGLMKKKRKNK